MYGDDVVTLKTICKCYDGFKSGNESIDDEQRPLTSKIDDNVQTIETMVRPHI